MRLLWVLTKIILRCKSEAGTPPEAAAAMFHPVLLLAQVANLASVETNFALPMAPRIAEHSICLQIVVKGGC